MDNKYSNNGTVSLSALCIREGAQDTVLYIVVAIWSLGLVKTDYVILQLLIILDL